MVGLIVEVIISWLLLWVFFKQGLSVLGIAPTQNRLVNLFSGFLITAGCCAIYYLSFTFFTTNRWRINNEFSGQKFLEGSWWTLQSVLYEELIFRGALLYLLINKLGTNAACIISALCFGIYHWFTSGVMGNPLQMTFVFVMTAVWGVMFAMAFARTKSLYLPIGLHFGWNIMSTVVFSQGPLGNQLLTITGGQKLGGILSLVVFFFQLFAVPIIMYWYFKMLTKRQKTSMAIEQLPLTAADNTVSDANRHRSRKPQI